MAVVRIAIDTSIFRRDPRLRGGAFEALARLAEAGYVDVLIPDVVAREFTSLPTDKAQAVAGLRKALSDLRRVTPDDFAEKIDAFEAEVDGEFQRIEAEAEAMFRDWVARTHAKVIAAGEDHAARVLAKYFDGQAPFKSRKARADFPDAFIVEVLKDLASDDSLLVVTADRRMTDALRETANITVFENLKELLESDDFDDVRTEVEAANIPFALTLLQQTKTRFDGDIEDGIVNLLGGTSVHYRDASWDEKEGSEHLYIESIGRVIEWTIDTDGSDYLGEGVVSLAFGGTIEVELGRPSGDSGYYHGDEYYPASSMEAVLEVNGTCSLILSRDDLRDPSARSKLDDILDRSRIEVDELDGATIKYTERDRW